MMNSDPTPAAGAAPHRKLSDLIGSFGFGYLLTIVLMGVPIYLAGIWNIIANTRFLDLLISAGVISYTDEDRGFILGIPKVTDYLKSQDPVDERLILICFCIYLLHYLVKAIQFHKIARVYGLEGSFGQHARAFFYGIGLNRLLPFNAGDVGTVSALKGQGESPEQASSVLHVQDMFVHFEIAFFLFLGLVLTGWRITFNQTVPALVLWAVFYFIVRSARRRRTSGREPGSERPSLRVLRELANEPFLLIGLGLLSLLAFFLDDITPYVTSQAFTSTYVHLNVPFLVIQAGVVAGYIASRVPITPGCIGQFEFGFGTALYFGGASLPVAITIAILDGLIRHSVALTLFIIVKVWHGIETDVRATLHLFMGKTAEVTAQE